MLIYGRPTGFASYPLCFVPFRLLSVNSFLFTSHKVVRRTKVLMSNQQPMSNQPPPYEQVFGAPGECNDQSFSFEWLIKRIKLHSNNRRDNVITAGVPKNISNLSISASRRLASTELWHHQWGHNSSTSGQRDHRRRCLSDLQNRPAGRRLLLSRSLLGHRMLSNRDSVLFGL